MGSGQGGLAFLAAKVKSISVERVLAALFLSMSLLYAWHGMVSLDGRARVLPVASGLAAAVCAAVVLVTSKRSNAEPLPEAAASTTEQEALPASRDEASVEHSGTAAVRGEDVDGVDGADGVAPGYVVWVLGAFGIVFLMGFMVGLPLFIFLYLRFRGQETYRFSILYAVIFIAVIAGIFGQIPGVRFYPGLLDPASLLP